MLNLLPTREKKKLRTEYYIRLATVVVSMFALVFILGGAFLVPVYIAARYEKESAVGSLATHTNTTTSEDEERDAGAILTETNKRVQALLVASTATGTRSIPSDLFSKILTFKTPAIKITSFVYSGSLGQEQVKISGVSQDRESLALFAEGLRKSGVFTAVELPVRSYVKSSNIDFSITLTRALKKSA